MFKRSELKILNTSKALEYLLESDKPDFNKTLERIIYEKELIQLQSKFISAQTWVVENNKRLIIIAEGREFAGKGGAIHVFTEHLNPRSIRTVALNKPSSEERQQWYFKRYIDHIPEAGQIVFFDRSWYNRALVEPVNGFCTKSEYQRFMKEVNHFERMLSEDGIIIIKLFFTVSKKQQEQRIEEVKNNPLRRWELSSVDLNATKLWSMYNKYEKKMFEITDTKDNPWHIYNSDNKRVARIKAFNQILKILSSHAKKKF